MAQIGTVRLETQNSGVVDVPVFEPGDSASGIYEFVRVETASGPGFIPVTDPVDATYPYLRVQSQNNGIVAVTDTPGSDIPDTVVSRDPDDNTFSTDVPHGLRFETSQTWPEIGATISANSSGFTTATVERVSDGQLMGSKDISGLSAGDSFFIGLDSELSKNETFDILLGAGGSTYSSGYDNNPNFPFTSNDSNLSITSGSDSIDGAVPNAHSFVSIGNV